MGKKSNTDLYGRPFTKREIDRLRRREDRQKRRNEEWIARFEKERGTFFPLIHLVLGIVTRWMSARRR